MADLPDVYFDEPRLRMTIGGRLVVRAVSYAAYLILSAATFTMLISDIRPFTGPGILLALFLVDRLRRRQDADQHLGDHPPRGRVNAARYLAPAAYAPLEKAYDRSGMLRHDMHLEIVLQLSAAPEVRDALERLDVKIDEFRQKTEELLSSPVAQGSDVRLQTISEVVQNGFRAALTEGHGSIGPADLFAGLAALNDPALARLFNQFNVAPPDLERALIFGATKKNYAILRRLPAALGGLRLGGPRIRHRIMNRAWTSKPTPVLDAHSADLTDLAREGYSGFMIGHEDEYERLVDALARPVNPNVLLVGDAGIGKETIVSHLAYKISKDEVPAALFDRRLVSLELSSLVAGADAAGLHDRLEAIVSEIIRAGNVILYIPDIHNLLKTSGTAYLSAADALMPIIMNNAFPVIGGTYPREFKQVIEQRSDFVGSFDVIHVNEVTEAEAERILAYESVLLEGKSKIVISFGAIKTAVLLAKKYFHTKYLPTSASELLKEAFSVAEEKGEHALGPDQVVTVAEGKVSVPIHEATEAEAENLLQMEALLHEEVIGQDEAVKAVADALREYRSGLARPGGPIASFLFVGPTGVGKTQLAKALARIQFGSEKAMVRFDMTEYQDKQSFYRFIGSADGTVAGALTDAIREKPYSLVLLDEFEKAFPDILNLFLQVLDDGRLTDGLGRTVDFTNTIIIATSNAHSDIMNDALSKGEQMADIADYVKKKLVDIFRPELLNRFSRIIVFRNLKIEEVSQVALLNLKALAKSVEGQGIELTYDPAAVTRLAQLGYDPAFGARPLRRTIDDKLRAPLAQKILKKEIGRGVRARLVVTPDDKFDFVPDNRP